MTLLILLLTSSLMSWLKSIFSRSFRTEMFIKMGKIAKILFLGVEEADFLLCSKQVDDPLYQLNIFPLLLFFVVRLCRCDQSTLQYGRLYV